MLLKETDWKHPEAYKERQDNGKFKNEPEQY
jgi:hypothetical protein